MKAVLFTKIFPKDSLKELAQRVKKMGFQGIEYPFRSGYQVEMENAPRGLPLLAKAMKEEGIEITVATANFDENNSSYVEAFYEAVGKQGIPFIRPAYYRSGGLYFWSQLEVARKKLKSLAKLSAKYGPKTLLHNHSGSLLTCSCLGARMLADTCDPEYVGIYIDFAHLSLNGEPFEMALGICGEYLSLVGVKANRYVAGNRNEKGELQYKVEWTPLKDGITDWTKAVKLLKKVAYNGPYIFHAEYTACEEATEFVVQDRKFLTNIVEEDKEEDKR